MHQLITILGSTGSIGANSLDVISQHPDHFKIFALTANVQYEVLANQCLKHEPSFAVMIEPKAAQKLKSLLKSKGSSTQVLCGAEDLNKVAQEPTVDAVIAGIVGSVGLRSTMAAVESGKKVLLANKESLVMAGGLFKQAIARSGCVLLPIDSEHNGIFQCLQDNLEIGLKQNQIKLTLPASGGPFRGWDRKQMADVTPKEACAHPNWKMGRKISVDSATLMNKGLEVIEASFLFDIPADLIDVVIHPQSVIHAFVHFADGSTLAHMGIPDMRVPIAHALAWPKRIKSGVKALDLSLMSDLQFSSPDHENFPSLKIAYEALSCGGDATTILNAANETAVGAFLSSRIKFTQISEIVRETLSNSVFSNLETLEEVEESDSRARSISSKIIEAIVK
jgi:1-deoxy-D-xylulose-5-phosphate reductoisomerase